MQVSDKPGGPRSKDKSAPATIVPNTNKHATQGKIKWSLTCKRNQNHIVKHQLHMLQSRQFTYHLTSTYISHFIDLHMLKYKVIFIKYVHRATKSKFSD